MESIVDSRGWIGTPRGERKWSLCATLPTTPVHDLALHPTEHELVIGTHGRSVWALDVTGIRD